LGVDADARVRAAGRRVGPNTGNAVAAAPFCTGPFDNPRPALNLAADTVWQSRWLTACPYALQIPAAQTAA